MIYDKKLFGHFLKEARCEKKLSIENLSKISSVSCSTILSIEKGTRTFTIETIEILSYALNINLLELLLKSDTSNKKKLFSILNSFVYDLFLHQFDQVDLYIEELNTLYSSITYSTELNDLFDIIEASLLWLKGISKSIISNSYLESEIIFFEALSIRNPSISLENIFNYKFNIIELHIINSIIANRSRHNVNISCLALARFLYENISTSLVCDINLNIIARNNYCNILLEENLYNDALELSQSSLKYLKKMHIHGFYLDFKLLLSVSEYCTKKTSSTYEIINILNALKPTKKAILIPAIIENLSTKYNIPINLSDLD